MTRLQLVRMQLRQKTKDKNRERHVAPRPIRNSPAKVCTEYKNNRSFEDLTYLSVTRLCFKQPWHIYWLINSIKTAKRHQPWRDAQIRLSFVFEKRFSMPRRPGRALIANWLHRITCAQLETSYDRRNFRNYHYLPVAVKQAGRVFVTRCVKNTQARFYLPHVVTQRCNLH